MMNSSAWQESLERLKKGNKDYINYGRFNGDVSEDIREKTSSEGQSPYAVIIACSDSRVIPEAIFSAGIGSLFVIRTAGNTIGVNELGSIEYAVGHLGCPLVVVLGHTHCGAVDAAMHGEAEGHVAAIIKEIQSSIKSETDAKRASILNAEHSASVISENISGVKIISAVYDIETGRVEWL